MAVARIIAGFLSVSCMAVAASVAPCNPTDDTCDAAQTQILLQRDSRRRAETEAFIHAGMGSHSCPNGYEPATRAQCESAATVVPGTTFNKYAVCHSHWPSGCFQWKEWLFWSPCIGRALTTDKDHQGVCVKVENVEKKKYDGCVDSVVNWQDSGQVGCADYAERNYCTGGKVGSGWNGDLLKTNGKNALQVCCVCGGGFDVEEDFYQAAEEIWTEFDIDKSGVLEEQEAAKPIQNILGKNFPPKMVADAFSEFDLDSNGSLDKVEMYKLLMWHYAQEMQAKIIIEEEGMMNDYY